MANNICRTEVFSRVTGFYRPVQEWNKGKTAEFDERKRFGIPKEIKSEEEYLQKT